jgi:hypothetical protein
MYQDWLRRRSWLRNRATSRKVSGSILDGATGIFHWLHPSGRTSGQLSPTEKSTTDISWGLKVAGA